MFTLEKFRPNLGENRKGSETKAVFKSPESRKVTDRNFKQYLRNFCFSETELASKKILDIGSGLSDFSLEVNRMFKESGAMAVSLDPLYQALGKNQDEFRENIKKADMDWKSFAGASDNSAHIYEKIKNAPCKVAGSHQRIPFEDKSFDLVLANNSITQYKDREITRMALAEAVRVTKENGEIRIQPADLRWDWRSKSFYVHTFEAPTPETKQEAQDLGLEVGPDKKIFEIFKETEKAGFTFYVTIRPKSFMQGHRGSRFFSPQDMEPAYSLILRKDSQLPKVDGVQLKTLSFRDSEDDLHVPSSDVFFEKQNKNDQKEVQR
jgi:ubiquinone/menaquinone biosynthesis C-methylase UbiE